MIRQTQKISKKLVYIAEIPVSILNRALNYGKIYIDFKRMEFIME